VNQQLLEPQDGFPRDRHYSLAGRYDTPYNQFYWLQGQLPYPCARYVLLFQAVSLYGMFYMCHTVLVLQDDLAHGRKHNPVCRYDILHSCYSLLPYGHHVQVFHRQYFLLGLEFRHGR
jgi:hypothetical protein